MFEEGSQLQGRCRWTGLDWTGQDTHDKTSNRSFQNRIWHL